MKKKRHVKREFVTRKEFNNVKNTINSLTERIKSICKSLNIDISDIYGT